MFVVLVAQSHGKIAKPIQFDTILLHLCQTIPKVDHIVWWVPFSVCGSHEDGEFALRQSCQVFRIIFIHLGQHCLERKARVPFSRKSLGKSLCYSGLRTPEYHDVIVLYLLSVTVYMDQKRGAYRFFQFLCNIPCLLRFGLEFA